MNTYDLLSPQEEELEALRSIWGDEWVDLPPQKTAWNVKGEEGWWTVRVKGSDERVSVKLKGRLTKLYPKAPPLLSLEEPVNLTPGQVQTLNRIINDKAKQLSSVDEPVGFIYDITDCIHDWISNNHIPLRKLGEKVPTLMEEMAQREQAQRAAEIAQNEAERTERLARIAEQDRLLNEKIQHDATVKAQKVSQAIQDEAARRRQQSLASLADGELEMRELVMDEAISVDGFAGSFYSWVLFAGKKEPLWTSYIAEPASVDGQAGIKATLPVLTVQVVDFSASFYNTAQGRKKVDAVAVEIGRLREVKCEHVVRIYGVKRDKSPKGWERLIVLTERVEGGKVRTWLPRDGFSEEVSREYITQIIIGLVNTHRIGATQKQIDPNCTFLASSDRQELVAKLAGTGYARRISDLHRSNPFLKGHEEEIPEQWLSPDEIDSPYTYTPKRDIWHAGVLLVQLLFGFQSLWRFPNLQILLQHSPGLTDGMIELLSGLLHPNAKKRLTAEEALNRARSVDETTRRGRHASAGSVSMNHAMPSPKAVFGTSPVSGINYFPTSMPNLANAPRSSRYREDFQEVEFLGKGGFGEVVKARNRLDGRAYAIKKVKLRPEDNEAKVYREVNNLSRVSHPNVVRYHACWIEDASPLPSNTIDSSDAVTPTASASEETSDPFAVNFDDLSRSRDHSRSASFPRIRFANSETDSDNDDESGSDSSDTKSDSSEATAADPSEQRSRGRAMTITHARPSLGPGFNPAPSGSLTDTTDGGAFQSILYIQMEFVEKQTLREAISAGLEEEDVWRLLGQILQALAHMASLGIVHRDLKPSNILIDANGNVKIADFGLSTTEMSAVEAASAPTGSVEDDRTSGIGTSLYIAPEVAISRSYNEKADMYSLGVIFFEMCFAFKTNMERVYILNALRQPSITFPASWSKDVKPKEREIVEWLLRHDPNMRPRAEQLLASPLLPARENQKEFYDAAIPELTNPRSTHYPTLLKCLFDPQTHLYTSIENRTNDYTYDNPTDHLVELEPWMTVVTARLTDLLQRHGAVETTIPLLIPETLLLEVYPDLTPVRVMDRSGKIIQLPSSDLLSMARSATRRQIERIKRYHVGHRYKDHISGGQPTAEAEISFDIISPIRSGAAEAECLDVIDKVVGEMGGGGGGEGEFEIHVSHETVLATILQTATDRARSSVLKVLKDISANLGASSRVTLGVIPHLSKQVQDDIEHCCAPGDFATVRHRLETTFPNARRKLVPALDATASILALTAAFGVKTKIVFRPSMARNAEFFRGGFMFECIRRGKQRDSGKQRELIAYGGRYDSLLEHFKAPSQHRARRVYGVGMSLAIEPLARLVGSNESALARRHLNQHVETDRSFGYWSPARCDVYVMNVHQVDLSVRLAIVGELWRAGVKTDLQYDDERNFNDIVEECSEQNTLFIVQPQPARAGPLVKVYNVLHPSNDKELVHRSELVTYLRQAIAEQRRLDASYAAAEGSLPSAQPAVGVNGNDSKGRESQIKMILPPEPGPVKGGKKGEKKKNQRLYLQASKFVFTDKLDEFVERAGTTLPILGVDLSSALLSQLTLNTEWINDDEAWRSVLANYYGDDRKYLDSVREHVQKEVRGDQSLNGSTGMAGTKKSPAVWVWLFSVREAKGFLLQPVR